jgi:D-glycero-alpha-D-manno-heptose-7-phosphate kinase
MIISRTPLRISFFGGGTDYPAWFKKNGGAVLATTIDKYIYMTCRYLPPFFAHKSRIVWSFIELVKDLSEIQHPSVRECLRFMKIKKGVEIHYDADLPAKAGLGSSSTFTVGLLNSLYALKGIIVPKMQLAKEAIYVEQNILKENVGCQDQILASFGGLNLIEFRKSSDFHIHPITISAERLKIFHRHLLLIFTGFTRISSVIGKEWIKQASQKCKEYELLHELVYAGVNILNSNDDLGKFGKLLHEGWKIKRSLSHKISNPTIDEVYSLARRLGASGGKLLGAGGGGFLLIFAKPEIHPRIKSELKKFLYIPFNFENLGSQIVFYNP